MSKAVLAVNKVFEECGITDPLQLPLEVIINSKNIIIKEEVIDGADGRILMKDNSGVITLNSNINFPVKKRFILAHELGHFELHRHSKKGYCDDDETLNHWYSQSNSQEETEANEFASEFLMPQALFSKECQGNVFNHKTIEYLANRFNVGKTAAILKFVKKDNGNHPIFVICCQDNKMKWFKKSYDWRYFSLFQRGFAPPSSTVAAEVFHKGMQYYGDEKTQQIWKSDWFVMKDDENDMQFFEYCLYVSSYNYMISVIWEK
jgi:Zn-dependent peptidase ImmA (M78 family)